MKKKWEVRYFVTAVVSVPVYKTYSKMEAYKQAAKDGWGTVYRDENKDLVCDEDCAANLYTNNSGYFGIYPYEEINTKEMPKQAECAAIITVSALSKDMLGLGLSTKEALGRINALAEEFDISEDEVLDKLGKLDVDRAVDAIYSYLGGHFAGAAAGLENNTYSGASGILASYQDDIAAAAGKGYNTLRTEGLRAEIKSLGGALGDAMKGINTIIGENQARGENLRDEYIREAVSAVLLGENSGLFTDEDQATLDEWAAMYDAAAERYAAGEEKAGLEMQALYENAQMLGQAAYDSSEWAQAAVDVQMEQIAAIRDNTAGLAAATDAFRTAQEKSKGQAAAVRSALSKIEVSYGDTGWYDEGGTYHYTESELASTPGWYDDGGNFHPYAYGLDRVPYDDYPALLHEGERVLTASQARTMDQGGGAPVVQVTVTGNNFVGTGEEMADQIAEILVRKLEQAVMIHQP